jgi:excisionase family DNA binding protein
LLTVPEAARRARCAPETVRRWIRSGQLRASKVGSRQVIEESDLQAVLDEVWPVEIPAAWRIDRTGAPQPDWESIVRETRDSH